MKKLVLTLALTALTAGAFAQNHSGVHSGFPFTDEFDVTLSGVSPQVVSTGNTNPNVTNYGTPTCNGDTECTFHISSNGTWSGGSVDYTIGDKVDNKPYCDVTVTDGALSPAATMMAQCYNGASASVLQPLSGNKYNFSVTASTK